jgi:drug/metabolite transporter (DMT)-like permease
MPAMFFCVASAACFGAMAVLGKLAYDGGATVGTLLSLRFAIAAALFWLFVERRDVRLVRRGDVVRGLALGAVLYAVQAGMYFAALDRLDASLLSLLVYTFPAIVAVMAVLLGRERFAWRRAVAVVVAFGGLALVVGRAGTGALDPVGVGLALATAVAYAAYILVGEGVAGRVPARLLAALVCTGASVTLSAGSALLGDFHPERLSAAGWGWIGALAVVSTVLAVSLLFAGLRRVGPTTSSVLCNVEPVVTVVLAWVVFGEVLGGAQLVGAALVLGAVVALSGRLKTPARPERPSLRRPLSRGAAGRVGRRGRADGGTGRTAEQRAPHAGEAGGERGEELGQRGEGTRLDEDGLDLRDGARAGLVAPRDVQVLAADDLREVRGENEVGVGVVDRQVEVRHLSGLP